MNFNQIAGLTILLAGILFILFVFLKLTKKSPWWSRGIILLVIGGILIIYSIFFSIEIGCRNVTTQVSGCGLGEFLRSLLSGLFLITFGFLFFFRELIIKTKKSLK
jgi:hypothetical protein